MFSFSQAQITRLRNIGTSQTTKAFQDLALNAIRE
jgi:hypothetical protein